MNKKYTGEKGAAMIIVVLFFIILSTTLLIGISAPISNQIKGTNEFLTSKSSYSIADSQAENAMYRFNKGKTDAPTDLTLLGATASAVLTNVGGDKSLVVEGSKSIFDRYIKAIFRTGDGIAFNYGLQLGNGGLVMEGSAHVNGNVYANGDISGNGGSGWYTTYISGTAIAATVANPTLSLSVSTTTQTLTAFPFGQTNTNQDIAQSFVAGTTTAISQINLYIKKTGTPANVTVKIVNNNSGVPGSTLITSGTLSASTVTTSYAYVPTLMSSAVALASGTTYWIVLDTASNNASSYYSLATYTNVYSAGATKQGRFGTSFADLSPTTQDFDFSVWVGGDAGSITNMGVGTSGTGDAWANTITNTKVTGNLYCQSGSGNTNSSGSAKACDTSRADPVSVSYPVSDANIAEWEADATAGGSTSTISIAGTATRSLGPIKINGNLTVTASGNLNITGPIYVTGNVVIDGNSDVAVDSTLSNSSAVITADGSITIGTSGDITGAGSNSYLVFNSDKTCTTTANCTSNPSIIVSGDAGAIILNTLNGGVSLAGSATVKAVVAKQLYMNGSTAVNYEAGLADVNFTSGPSGAWTKQSWKEVLGW